MRLESPVLNLETDASVETITAAVSKLEGKEPADAFLILSVSDLTYMQVSWTSDGYVLEYQAGSTKSHFEAKELLSAEDVRFILIEYLQGADGWKSKYSFNRLDLDEIEKEMGDEGSGRMGAFLVGLVMAFGLLYVGGWSLIWDQAMFAAEALVLRNDGFAVRFNSSYYGAQFTSRFFDSPAISWLCLMFATGLTPVGFFFEEYWDEL